jgi:predicted Zn-dependent peptidase
LDVLHRSAVSLLLARLIGAFVVVIGSLQVTDVVAEQGEVPHRVQALDSRGALTEMMAKVVEFTLSNGVRVLMYRRGEAPVFSGAVVVRVGGSDEVVGTTGVSHMFEHMAFKGSQRIGTRDYERERKLLLAIEEIAARSKGLSEQLTEADQQRLEDLNAELQKLWIPEEFSRIYDRSGATGLNATTDKELTRYFVSLPRPSLELWASLESDRIIAPVMRQFYQERDVVMEERRMRSDDDPTGKLYETLLATAFTQHPYRHPVIGYADDISKLTATQTDEFRQRYYVGSNIVVALVGDVDAERDRGLLERYFGRIPAGAKPARPTVVEPPQLAERSVEVQHPSSPEVLLAYHKPNYPHRDDPALSVMSEILAGSRISPLYSRIVQRDQLAVSIDADEGPGFAYPNLLIFHSALRQPHTAAELLTTFDSVLKEFIETGPTEEQVAIAKRAVAMAYLTRMGSSMSIALDLASSEILYDDWRAGLQWYDEAMAVTAQDVKRVAGQYLKPQQRTVVTIKQGKAPETVEQKKGGYHGTR